MTAKRRVAGACALLASALPLPGHAQELEQAQTGGRVLAVVPTFSASSTATDNRGLAASAQKQSELITQISPGVRITARTAALQGAASYAVTGVAYARDSEPNEIRQTLDAALKATLVDNQAFVDARASISRQAISAFGAQASNTEISNDNITEYASFGIAPSLRGSLAGVVNYDFRLSHDVSRAASTEAGDAAASNLSLALNGGSGFLGWGLDASRQMQEYSAGRDTVNDRAFATLLINPDVDLRLSLRAGKEANDVLSDSRQTRDSWGWGLNWRPGPRTSLSIDRDRRYFGNAHNVQFQHRMAQSVLRYTDSRDSSGSSSFTSVSAYDLFYVQFASLEPDPVKRDLLVRSYLGSRGIALNANSGIGFLNSALTLQRRQELSMAVSGQRTTFTLAAYRSDSRRLDTLSTVQDDLSGVDRLRQIGATLSAAYRLTPVSAITLVGARQKTLDADGSGAAAGTTIEGNDQRSINLFWTTAAGPRTSFSLGGRYTEFISTSAPYTEGALTATLSLQF